MVAPGEAVTATVRVDAHPAVFVPVTVYVVEMVGHTCASEAVILPGIQVYEFPPVAVSVAQLPGQTAVGFATAVLVGSGLTTSMTVRVELHPEVRPVTVYVVVTVGDTTTVPVVRLPGIHVYEVAPDAVSVLDCPRQITVGEADAITVGTGTTLTFFSAVLVQVPLLAVSV